MISFKVNGKPVKVPTAWGELTYSQYQSILSWDGDMIKLVSLFTGLEYDSIRNAVISGLDKLLEALSFVTTQPELPGYVDQCGPYKIPDKVKGKFNVQYESLAQFEDARSHMKKLDGTTATLVKTYGSIVSIYLQKLRDGEYDPLKVPSMEEEVKDFNAFQVLSLGAFFFIRLTILLTGTGKGSPSTQPPPKNKKRVLNGSQKHSVRLRPSRKSR